MFLILYTEYLRLRIIDVYFKGHEYRICHKSKKEFYFEFQVNSKIKTVKNGLREFLLSLNKRKYLIFYDCNSTGDLKLQDGLLCYEDLSMLLEDKDIKKTFNKDSKIEIYLSADLLNNNLKWKELENVS